MAAGIGVRVLREVVERVAIAEFGAIGGLLVFVLVVGGIIAWRLDQKRRIRKRGGAEFTPEMVRQQVTESAVGPPAFHEDGSLLGSSVFAVNQHTKILEIETGYSIFDSQGATIGEVRQIGQSRAKQWARALTAFDQYFTHHFEVLDGGGNVVLRITRPRKWFRSKVHVFDARIASSARSDRRTCSGRSTSRWSTRPETPSVACRHRTCGRGTSRWWIPPTRGSTPPW